MYTEFHGTFGEKFRVIQEVVFKRSKSASMFFVLSWFIFVIWRIFLCYLWHSSWLFVAFFLVICRTFLCYLRHFSLIFVGLFFVICRIFWVICSFLFPLLCSFSEFLLISYALFSSASITKSMYGNWNSLNFERVIARNWFATEIWLVVNQFIKAWGLVKRTEKTNQIWAWLKML